MLPSLVMLGATRSQREAIRRFEHEMTMTTIQEFNDDALEGFRVKLADGNAIEAMQEIGQRVVGEAL